MSYLLSGCAASLGFPTEQLENVLCAHYFIVWGESSTDSPAVKLPDGAILVQLAGMRLGSS